MGPNTAALLSTITELSLTYAAMVLFQSALAVLLFALLSAVYYRRQTLPYLFLWLAASTLLLEGLVGIVGLFTRFDPMIYVVVDHGLDILLISLVLGAVLYARRLQTPRSTYESS